MAAGGYTYWQMRLLAAAPYRLAAPARDLAMVGHPCRWPGRGCPPLLSSGREENRRGRPKLQPINHKSPLLFIESHQKTLWLLP
ncbi:hypothetical protein BHM03_00031558 [Ensete ventricosum]|nr:hypothetical protein BHM03_00031558 [Ensete ventricosum]